LQTVFEARKLVPPAAGSVVSVGVFDGVHLGHLAILIANVERARHLGAVSAIVTFRRHPKRVLLGRAPRALTTLEHRLELFRRAGIGLVAALDFDAGLSQMEAPEFVARFLVAGLHTRHLVLGFDSKFGRDRQGTPEWLAGQGWPVDIVPQVVVGHRPVSSTAIREAVDLGDLASASAMLGRPVAVLGRVVRGEALGRRIGFPTANLDLRHALHPPEGVWAGFARVAGADPRGEGGLGPPLAAVANIGRRPTVSAGAADVRVEVHLLDGAQDLYGKSLEFEFHERLRGEQRFENLDALQAQIANDCARARELLAAREPGRVGSDPGGESRALPPAAR